VEIKIICNNCNSDLSGRLGILLDNTLFIDPCKNCSSEEVKKWLKEVEVEE